MSLHPNEVLLSPVVSEKSYSLIEDNKYSFRVYPAGRQTSDPAFTYEVKNFGTK